MCRKSCCRQCHLRRLCGLTPDNSITETKRCLDSMWRHGAECHGGTIRKSPLKNTNHGNLTSNGRVKKWPEAYQHLRGWMMMGACRYSMLNSGFQIPRLRQECGATTEICYIPKHYFGEQVSRKLIQYFVFIGRKPCGWQEKRGRSGKVKSSLFARSRLATVDPGDWSMTI
jgi:hypothetical protein